MTLYQDALTFLDRHIGLGFKPGLERMAVLLDLLANPHEAYPIIHITGSNGKTSTARIASSLLAAHGLTVGTFTSPHLERVEERLSINGTQATPGEFAQAVADVEPFADLLEQRTGERPTYFELTAAIALAWFASHAVDVAVIEVGLGGRLDATNAADGRVAVVTGVSLEHVDYLGETVAQIAREKLAIAKSGAFWSPGRCPRTPIERQTRMLPRGRSNFGDTGMISGWRRQNGQWVAGYARWRASTGRTPACTFRCTVGTKP